MLLLVLNRIKSARDNLDSTPADCGLSNGIGSKRLQCCSLYVCMSKPWNVQERWRGSEQHLKSHFSDDVFNIINYTKAGYWGSHRDVSLAFALRECQLRLTQYCLAKSLNYGHTTTTTNTAAATTTIATIITITSSSTTTTITMWTMTAAVATVWVLFLDFVQLAYFSEDYSR